MKKPILSVIVFTRNEAVNIKACLEPASQLADEIVLIDNNSEDQTVEIAKGFKKTRVYQHKLTDFASQHNFGQKKATGDWLFFLDADERISKQLSKQIEEIIKNSRGQMAFKVNRINIFLGQELKYGGWSPDTPTRLFKRDSLIKWQGAIHESAVIKGETSYLNGALYHLGHRSLTAMLDKTIKWSVMEAKLRLQASHPLVTWWRVLRMGVSEFFKRLIVKQGWRDGMAGWLEVIYQSISIMVTYLRLWEMQI